MNDKTLKPLESTSRIDSLDVIRGIALFGILLMNIIEMGLPFSYSDSSVLGHDTGWNLWVWKMNELLFEGTMRGLFSMLFGAGVILLTSRLEKSGAGIKCADIYYRRTIWLLVFGIVHVWLLLWYGDILYPYAIFAFFCFLHEIAFREIFSFLHWRCSQRQHLCISVNTKISRKWR